MSDPGGRRWRGKNLWFFYLHALIADRPVGRVFETNSERERLPGPSLEIYRLAP